MDNIKKILIIWILLNLVILPLNTFAETKHIISNTIRGDTLNNGVFGEIKPLDGLPSREVDSPNSYLLLYFLMLGALSLLLVKSRKGQITLYLLVGLVLLFIFGFLFYFRYTVLTQDTDIKESTEIFDTSFKGFVQSCLDKALIEGLDLVGKQGGFIYEGQGGVNFVNNKVIPVYYVNENKIYNLTYALIAPQMPAPEYPYNRIIPISLSFSNVNYYGSYNLGRDTNSDLTIPPLCQEQSLNSIYLPGINYTCVSYGDKSIQESLNKFVENKASTCLNYSYFQDKLGLTIQNLSFDLDLLIGDEDVQAFFNYSITVAQDQGKIIHNYFLFSSKQNIRLKNVHELAQQIIVNEAKDLSFKLGDNEKDKLKFSCNDYYHVGEGVSRLQRLNPTNCVKDGMNVSINPSGSILIREQDCGSYYIDPGEKNHCTNATIIQITDSKSILVGKSYQFNLAIENRRPVINLLPDQETNSGSNTPLVPSDSPLVVDPDDRINQLTRLPYLSFKYQENSVGVWNDINSAQYDSSTGILYPSQFNIGQHPLRLIVSDQEGLQDWQEFTITVN